MDDVDTVREVEDHEEDETGKRKRRKVRKLKRPIAIEISSESDTDNAVMESSTQESKKRPLKGILKRPREPIVISSDSDTDAIRISSEDEYEPPKKRQKCRVEEDENKIQNYVRDPEEYAEMHKNQMKPMKPTKQPKKIPFNVFFPEKRASLLQKMNDKRYGRHGRVYVVKRLNDLVNNHLRVKKLNSGNMEPLLPEEECQFDVDEILDQTEKNDTVIEVPKQEHVNPQETPFDPNTGTDYLIPGKDFTDKQTALIAEIRGAEYLVYCHALKRYSRYDIHDHGVKHAVDDKDYPEHDLRQCECCNVQVFIGNWGTHITTYYHQIMLQVRKKLLGYCWFGNKNMMPHQVDDCTRCNQRIQYINENKSLTEWDDFALYDETKDPEYMAYLEREKAVNTAYATGRFSCIPCNKHNLSKEYYEKHLTGRAHKVKMREMSNDKGGKKNVPTESKKRKIDSGANPISSKKVKIGTPVSSKSPTASNDSEFGDSVTKNADGTYTCSVCEVQLKFKRNVKPHLKSKRHLQQAKDMVATDDERVRSADNLDEIGFARQKEGEESKSRPGTNFLLQFHRPCKYKIGRRLFKTVSSCALCMKAFRSPEILGRHQKSLEHRRNILRARAKRRLWAKPVAGGPRTHGELIEAIYQRHPDLFRKSCRIMRKRRERLRKEQGFITKAAICNEFGSRLRKNSHCHMFAQTQEKYTFQVFKKLFYKKFGIRISDIRRPINLRECIRYCTKEDRQALLYNVPMKFTSTVYRAEKYFEETNGSSVSYGDYIPSCIAACDRKVFESVLGQEGNIQDRRSMHDRVHQINLLPWQEELMKIMTDVKDCNRSVLWVVDGTGGAGKSVFCQYFMSTETFGRTILFQDMEYRNNTYLYNCESLVLFDLPRGIIPDNLRLVEDLKNGYIISGKYEVKKKIFKSPVIVIFSNSFPDKTLLSLDRWRVYSVDDSREMGGLRNGRLIHHPEFNI